MKEIQKLLNVSVSDYWQTHYMLDKISPKRSKNFGKTATDIIIINTIVPFLFIYGKHKKQEKFVERAIEFLEKTQGENNTIVNRFAALKFNVGSAYNTQSLLQLKNNYCSQKRCLHCGVGNSLLKK